MLSGYNSLGLDSLQTANPSTCDLELLDLVRRTKHIGLLGQGSRQSLKSDGGFSSRARILGECSTIRFPLALFFLIFFFLNKVEISWRTNSTLYVRISPQWLSLYLVCWSTPIGEIPSPLPLHITSCIIWLSCQRLTHCEPVRPSGKALGW